MINEADLLDIEKRFQCLFEFLERQDYGVSWRCEPPVYQHRRDLELLIGMIRKAWHGEVRVIDDLAERAADFRKRNPGAIRNPYDVSTWGLGWEQAFGIKIRGR